MAGAPRPYLVAPKTPLFRRTEMRVAVVLLAEAVVFLVLILAGAQTEADERRDQISQFTSLAQAQLYQSGAAQQSFTGPVILPELGPVVAQLSAGEVNKPAQIVENAQSWADVARRAGDGIAQIEADMLELKEARNLMEQGLLLYAQLADQVRLAVQLEGPDQKQLAAIITDQMNLAAEVFDTGWGKLQEARRKAGLETQSVLPGDLGGLPGGVPGLTGPGDVTP